MNTSNITNYKPKGFAELSGLCKYKKQIKEDEEFAKELQDGN